MTIHPARLDSASLQVNCEIRRQRRSGPGGQHRNKVETGIFVEHLPTGVRAEATESRSQRQNLDLALFRLRVNLAIQHRLRSGDTASGLWQSRLSGGRISVNARHADFPALLAEALDVLHDHGWDVKPAAAQLQCSASQLVKFLQREPRAFAHLNRHREQAGLSKLK